MYGEKFSFAQQVRGLFLRYFADLFKNYAKYIKRPANVLEYDLKDVFDSREFLESNEYITDFYKDLLLTRTWMLFIDGIIAPTSAEQIQKHKHFDECIQSLENEILFIDKEHFPEDLPNVKEAAIEYLFQPERYLDKKKSLQKHYLETVDINDI